MKALCLLVDNKQGAGSSNQVDSWLFCWVTLFQNTNVCMLFLCGSSLCLVMIFPVGFPGKDLAASVDAQAPARGSLSKCLSSFLVLNSASPAPFPITADFESCASGWNFPEISIKVLLVKQTSDCWFIVLFCFELILPTTSPLATTCFSVCITLFPMFVICFLFFFQILHMSEVIWHLYFSV